MVWNMNWPSLGNRNERKYRQEKALDLLPEQ